MTINRRDFLKMLGASAAIAVTSSPVISALASPALPPVLRTPARAVDKDPIAHVLNRLTFGARPGQADQVRAIGWQSYLDQQLNPDQIDDSANERRLGDYITLDMTVEEMIGAGKRPPELVYELDAATVMRAVYSERQLFEVMVNFWSEHFSIYHRKSQCEYFKTVDDREVIRKHALGNFRDLLIASAKSPAMLVYLDNAESHKEHPNENYAREVMELHTVTIGNYTETDVQEVARCFTGWTVQGLRGRQRNEPGTFLFVDQFHDDDAKTVLGTTIPAGGGLRDGELVLEMLAKHPATAKHIASKLCRRFLADDPPQNVIDAATQTFIQTDGEIKAVLRTIFAAPEFLTAPPKFKRPFEYMVGLARAFDAEIAVPLRPRLLETLATMGHLPFNWVTPDGYTDYSSEWRQGNLLLRWNLAIAFAYNAMRGIKTDLLQLAEDHGAQMTGRGIVDYYATHLLGRPLTTAEFDLIWQFASRNGEPNLKRRAGQQAVIDTIALIAASPAYQYR